MFINLLKEVLNYKYLNDILFIEEEPNNRKEQCHLCGNEDDVVQMKGTGEYLCGNGCDEEDADDE